VLISVASLWVAVRASHTQEKLLSASVWPFLQYETSDFPSRTNDIRFTLQNAGVGPARLEWVTLYYRGKAYATAREALRVCCGATRSSPAATEYLQGRVLTANQTVDFIRLPKDASDLAVWTRLDRQRLNFYLRSCYCSVLDECWLYDVRYKHHEPVKDCPPAEQPIYSG